VTTYYFHLDATQVSASQGKPYSAPRGRVPDRPALTFVVLTPEQSIDDEKRARSFIDTLIREHGNTSRTYKSALVFVVANGPSPFFEAARRILAWEEIKKDLPGISVDDTQIIQLEDNIKKSKRDLKGRGSGAATTTSLCSEKTTKFDSSILGMCIPALQLRSSNSSSMS
jgi:hypothetical protein